MAPGIFPSPGSPAEQGYRKHEEYGKTINFLLGSKPEECSSGMIQMRLVKLLQLGMAVLLASVSHSTERQQVVSPSELPGGGHRAGRAWQKIWWKRKDLL